MPTIVVASQNPVKLRAAQAGFARLFPQQTFDFQTVSVPSGVSDQPFSSTETLQGALNRARAARERIPAADYWVGIEGGVGESPEGELTEGELWAFAWVVVLGGKVGEYVGKGRTGALMLPPGIARLVREGKELGEADDIIFGLNNSKQSTGAVGLLTGDVIDRESYYAHAVILALIPFINGPLYLA